MLKSQIDSATLVLAVIAVTLGLTLMPGGFALVASLGGLCLLFILLAYDRDGYRSALQSLAYAAVFALSVTLAAAIILKMIALSYGQAHPETDQFATRWLPAVWIFVTVIFWPIDRARMSARLQFETDLVTTPPQRGPIITPHFTAPPPPPAAPSMTFVQPQRAPEATPPPPPPPRPVEQPPSDLAAVYTPPPVSYAPPPPPPAPVSYQPPAPAPPQAPPPAPIYNAPPPPPQPPPVSYQAPAPPAPTPFPAAVPITGRETMIYVTLVGEGLNVLRSVRAEHLGRDYYRIIDTVPEGETWEYGPGQVVRCKKKNLSSGKAMVAFEEAQRAQ